MARKYELMLWWLLAAGFGAALPGRAAASLRPLTEALEVRRGAACLNRDTLAAQVAAWLGTESIDRELSVLVVAAQARDVSFELRRGPALVARRRFFPAPAGCAPLEAILALAIAMALEVSLRDELVASLGGAPSALQSSLGAFAELGLGLLPGPSLGGAARAELRVHRLLALRFDGLIHTVQDQLLAEAPVRMEFDAWLAGVRVAACLLIPLTRALLARACAGVGAGSMRILGEGYRGARSARLPWVSVGAGAELSVTLSARWSVDAGGDLAVPLGERSFGVRDADGGIAAAEALPGVAGALRMGPVYHF